MKAKRILLLASSLCLSACLGRSNEASWRLPDEGGMPDVPNFSIAYTNVSPSGNSVDPGPGETPLPLVFGEIGVHAWFYRPGAGAAAGLDNEHRAVNNIESADWSKWEMLPKGQVATSFYLPSGQEVDIQKMSGSYWFRDITENFVRGVGQFRFDFLFIDGSPNVVTADNTICGTGVNTLAADQLLGSFPGFSIFMPGTQITDLTPRCFKISLYREQQITGSIALMARKDWFPEPVIVTMRLDSDGALNCFAGDRPLSPFQIEILDSLMDQKMGTGDAGQKLWPSGKYNANGCPFDYSTGGILPGVLAVAPFSTDVPVIQFSRGVAPEQPQFTTGGHAIPQADRLLVGSRLQARLNFNLYPGNISNWSDVNSASTHFPVCTDLGGCVYGDGSFENGFNSDHSLWNGFPYINMNSSTSGTPWGLAVDFTLQNP